jgi:catechol 2,3-dioxygenase-like lactoylglutathione lyase family enzyme
MSRFGLVFDHIHLISENPQEAATWYANKLGGTIVLNQEVLGAPQFYVVFNDMTVIIRGRRPGEEPVKKNSLHWGNDHFGFSVPDDFDRFCNDLKKKGVNFTVEPKNLTPTLRIAFLEGPDGVILELLQKKG